MFAKSWVFLFTILIPPTNFYKVNFAWHWFYLVLNYRISNGWATLTHLQHLPYLWPLCFPTRGHCLFFLSPGPEVKMISGRMSRAHDKILAGYLWWTSSSCLNPLHVNIGMHILHTVVNTFPKVLTRRICLLIKSFFHWWSFPLFSWP